VIIMNIPKKQKRYCKFCKRHTEHIVTIAKRRQRRKNTKSQRRFKRKLAGYGSFPKENPKGREKPTKKVDLRFKCTVCGKTEIIGKGFRAKKFEIKNV